MKNIINKLTGRAELLERLAVAETRLAHSTKVEMALKGEIWELKAKLSLGSKNLQAAMEELHHLRAYRERQANYKRAYSQRKKTLNNQTTNQNPQ